MLVRVSKLSRLKNSWSSSSKRIVMCFTVCPPLQINFAVIRGKLNILKNSSLNLIKSFIYDCMVVVPLKVKIRDIRTDLGFTQKELALKLKIEPAQLSQIENGKCFISLKKALFFSMVLSEITGNLITVNDLYELEKVDLK